VCRSTTASWSAGAEWDMSGNGNAARGAVRDASGLQNPVVRAGSGSALSNLASHSARPSNGGLQLLILGNPEGPADAFPGVCPSWATVQPDSGAFIT
jgi:hypothetical protein